MMGYLITWPIMLTLAVMLIYAAWEIWKGKDQ